MNNFKHLLLQTGIMVDQAGNILLSWIFFFWAAKGAWADETLSCRAYRAWKDNKLAGKITMPIIDFVFKRQSLPEGAIGHCHGAYIKERAKYNLPPEMRE